MYLITRQNPNYTQRVLFLDTDYSEAVDNEAFSAHKRKQISNKGSQEKGLYAKNKSIEK